MSSLERAEHSVNGPLLTFDLGDEVERIMGERPWHDGSRNAITLVKSENLRATLIALHGGSGLPEHHTHGRITLQVLSGRLILIVAGEKTFLETLGFVSLGEGIPHSIEALEDSVMLLTVCQ